MATIACIVTDDFEDSELRIPFDRFSAAGHKVVLIGNEKGKEITGKHAKERMRIERSIDEVRAEDFDALFIPGGFSPDKLRADPRFVSFVRRMDHQGKPIAAVCHGPQLLAAAGVLKGRRLNAYPAVGPDVTAAGGEFVPLGFTDAITDRNLVTGPAWTCHVEWLKGFLALLGTRVVHADTVTAGV